MDANKAEKLAAAKKKLKQFQQKSGSKSANTSSNHGHRDELHHSAATDVGSMTIVNHETAVETAFHPVILDNGTSSYSIAADGHGLLKTDSSELAQTVQMLTKEKMELLSSFQQQQELIRQLQYQLDEEKKAAESEREKSVQLQKAQSSSQSNSQEHELRNTLSILIEEKNDLTTAYNQSQSVLQKTEEELAELKLDHNTLQAKFALSEQCRLDDTSRLEMSHGKLAEELAALREELNAKNQAYADLSEELKELQIRQSHQTAELNQRETTVKELTSQIELLNLNMEQLRNAGPPTVDQSLEKMQKENGRLEAEIGDLREQLNKQSTEKEMLSQQYQQYILRLNGQIRTVNSQIEALALEKRNVEAALESKNERITELEAVISDLKRKEQSVAPTDNTRNKEGLDNASQTATLPSDPAALASAAELESLRKKVNEMMSDNDQLAKLALEKESRIQELEIRIDRLQSELNVVTASQDTVQSEKLLQAIQSDKMAASRAIAQNRQLKIQLEELEKAFIQLSNDKLALTDQAQVAARQNKEFSDKLSELEPELEHLRQEVTELAGQRDATIYWKQELEEAHERIQALSHQNAELKKRVIWNLSQEPSRNGKHKHHHHRHNAGDEATNEEDAEHSCSSDEEEDPDWVPREEIEKLRFHYGQLEQKLQKAMANVANLTDEKQKLEHLVLQLQSETETIGEYVSLYQVQRGLLRRRAEQLATERQRLKERIDKLTLLLPRLAPQLEKLPQWLQLRSADTEVPSPDVPADPVDALTADQQDASADQIASNVLSVLMEITSSHIADGGSQHPSDPSDPFLLDNAERPPHENFHPCQVCSGRLMTV